MAPTLRTVSRTPFAIVFLALCRAPCVLAQLSQYTFFNDTDFDPCPSPCVRVGNCGMGTNATCDPAVIAALCDANPPCLAFNSNGWLKGCAASACGSAAHMLEGVQSWVKHGGFWPPAPVPPVEDQHYPPEEPSETLSYVAELPRLISAGPGWAVLQEPGGVSSNVSVADFAFDTYLLLWAGVSGGASAAVVERTFERWAATSFLRIGEPFESARLRRGVGRVWGLSLPSYDDLTSEQPSYYIQAAWQPNDFIAQRVLNASTYGEPSFATAAAYLPPNREYASIGSVNAPNKFSVSPDGRVKSASSSLYTPDDTRNATQPGMLVWDPAGYVPWPDTNWSSTKTSLVGGFLRVIATAGFSAAAALGMEQIAFAPTNDPAGNLLVRLRSVNGSDPSHGSADSGPPHEYWRVSPSGTAERLADGTLFYVALFDELDYWNLVRAGASSFTLPGQEGARQVDTLWGSLIAALSLYVGDAANYGDGIYWSPNSSLTSQVATVDSLLNDLGLHGWAADRVSFNFAHFVGPDGSLPECTPCDSDGGFGDALADYGEQLELFTTTAIAQLGYSVNGSTWVSSNLAAFLRVANFTLGMWINATQHGAPPGDVTHGLVWGSPEHDTCKEPGYYYHNNVWLARGLTSAGRFLNASAIASPDLLKFAAQLLEAGAQLTADIAVSLNASVGRSPDGGIVWVPPVAALGTVPFNSMTESVYSSYANFRYFAEMLNAGILPDAVAVALMEFRESHAGTLSGMTHFEGHLDNMPSAGYAWASLVYDRPLPFWQLLYGHMASYASRGAFSASEQLAFTPDALNLWRDYLWEYLEGGIAQCVPSLVLPAAATRWALVLEHKDLPLVWLARGAPRRWFAPPPPDTPALLRVQAAPTRFGLLSFSAHNAATPSGEACSMLIEWSPPPFSATSLPGLLSLVLRMRASATGLVLSDANIAVVDGPPGVATITAVDAASESVSLAVTLHGPGGVPGNISLVVNATFKFVSTPPRAGILNF